MIGFVIVLAASALVALILLLRRIEQRRWRTTEPMPPDLQGSRLWASEKEFRCYRPVRLRGRVDQVYQTTDRSLVPVETKRRQSPVVYESDRLQLSQYRLLLIHRLAAWIMPVHVAGYGYVRLVTPGGLRYQKVDLMTTEEIVGVYERYLDVMAGKAKPNYCRNELFCDQCAYQKDCPRFGGRPIMTKLKQGARTLGRGLTQAFRR